MQPSFLAAKNEHPITLLIKTSPQLVPAVCIIQQWSLMWYCMEKERYRGIPA